MEFFRYLPAPAFGALAVAIFGIHNQPKILIIFIGTFFQQVLVIAASTRKLDPNIIEASRTLGAGGLPLFFGWLFLVLWFTSIGICVFFSAGPGLT